MNAWLIGINITMIRCRIVALETPGHFSLCDCINDQFLKQAPHGQMVWQIDPNYEITELLGCGSYGTVCRGRNISTGQIVAIKRIYMAQVCIARVCGVLLIPFFPGRHAIGTKRISPHPP